MGLHTGEATLGRDGYVGIAVHRGRCVCEAAHGGQIFVSSATHAIVATDPPDGIGFREVGEVRLAGFGSPSGCFRSSRRGCRKRSRSLVRGRGATSSRP